MKLENTQALIAVMLSILTHASVAVLGDYQFGKKGNKVGSLSVIVASHSSNKTTQQPSMPQTEQVTESESVLTTEPATTVSKNSVADKIVAPVTAEATAVHEKVAETFTIERAGKTTQKRVATPDSTAQTDRSGSATPSRDHNAGHTASFSATDMSPEHSQPQSVSSPPAAPAPDELTDNQTKPGGETADEGLVTTSIPVVSAIPLYHLIPKPPYPERSRDLGEEGTVIIAIKVAVDGGVAEAYVSKTSGYALLDGSALSSVRSQWRFRPATRAGNPVETWVRVPITFNIKKH